MEELQKRLQEAIAGNHFTEAENLCKSLKQRKWQERSVQLRKFHMRQAQREASIEDNFQHKWKEFSEKWSTVTQNFNKDWSEARSQLQQQINNERQQFKEKLEKSISPVPKPSAQLLRLVKLRDWAGKAHRFKEAEDFHKEILTLKATERKRYQEERDTKINSKIKHANKEFDYRLNRLDLKYKGILDEINLQKNKELQQAKQKINNVRNSLFTAQKIERNLAQTGTFRDSLRDIKVALNSSKNRWEYNHPQSPAQKYLSQTL